MRLTILEWIVLAKPITGEGVWPVIGFCLAADRKRKVKTMKDIVKILVAYDGSDCAKAALDDMRAAGLPAHAQAQVVGVLEVWLPPPSSWELSAGAVQASREMEVLSQAQEAAVSLRSSFPGWDISVQEEMGSPASILLKIADGWKPDLIIVGSHGRGFWGRLLGSVSDGVVHHAPCSVLVVR